MMLMVFYEPRPLYEAFIFLNDLASNISSVKYMNGQMQRNPGLRDVYSKHLETIVELETHLRGAVADGEERLKTIFGTLSKGKRKDSSGPESCLFNIIVPDTGILASDEGAFIEYLDGRAEGLPLSAVRFVSAADREPDSCDARTSFALINRSSVSQDAKFLLSDAVMNPQKYIDMLKELLLPVAEEFTRCRDIWSRLLPPYTESFSHYTSDTELLREKFDVVFDSVEDYSIYPSMTGYQRYMFADDAAAAGRVVCCIGVLYDLFKSQANTEANRASLVSHIMSVLGDQTRFNIFMRIAKKSTYGRELADELGLVPCTISEHLSILTGIGLITPHPEGRRTYYSVNYRNVEQFLGNLSGMIFINDARDGGDGGTRA